MYAPILPTDDENTQTSYNESLYQGDQKNLPAPTLEEQAKAYEKEVEATKISYRIFNSTTIGMERDVDGNVWFIADDICKVLGYKNTSKTVEDHCRGEIKKITKHSNGEDRAFLAISEPDLYRLIMRSRMPEAERFEKWVVEDVLPCIRKTGKFRTRKKVTAVEGPTESAVTAAPEVPDQLELFPRMVQSITFAKEMTTELNAAKKRLFESGKIFPSNKDYLAFVVKKGLEALEMEE